MKAPLLLAAVLLFATPTALAGIEDRLPSWVPVEDELLERRILAACHHGLDPVCDLACQIWPLLPFALQKIIECLP